MEENHICVACKPQPPLRSPFLHALPLIIVVSIVSILDSSLTVRGTQPFCGRMLSQVQKCVGSVKQRRGRRERKEGEGLAAVVEDALANTYSRRLFDVFRGFVKLMRKMARNFKKGKKEESVGVSTDIAR